MTKISVSNLETLIQNKPFEEIKNIMNNLDVTVRELTSQPNLYLLNYNDNNQGVVNESEIQLESDKIKLEANGIILEKETNKIVCMCQNKFMSYNDILVKKDVINFQDIRFEYCEDGTVIKLYNYNDEWITATTKCIDAKFSYWSSKKTFDELFWDLFDKEYLDHLDKSFTYIFILIHNDNRIVVKHKYNNLIYIGAISNISKEEIFKNIFFDTDPKRKIRRTKHIFCNSIVDDLEHFYSMDKRGIVVKILEPETQIWKNYKYDFENYTKLKNIRGNVPDIKLRYLELLKDPENLKELEKNYPEHKMEFAMAKHMMNKLYKEIHNLYFSSHINHQVQVEKDHKFYQTMKQLHGEYKTKGVKITLEEVKKKVNSLDKHVLKKFLEWK